MEVAGATVLVTGASGGIGQAIARTLASRGARLVLSGRDDQVLRPLAAELGADLVLADLRGDLAALRSRTDSIDVLVVCAAVDGGSSVPDDTAEHIDEVVDVNLRSALVLSTEFAQHRIAAGGAGQIVFIGSVSGLAPTPRFRLYNATKFGLRGFSLALRQDLRPHGIGATIITPGYIRDAGMTVDSGVQLPWYARTRSPEDVARAVVRSIETDPAEVFVAPMELRLAALGASVAPALAAWVHRRIGMDERREAARDPAAAAEREAR